VLGVGGNPPEEIHTVENARFVRKNGEVYLVP